MLLFPAVFRGTCLTLCLHIVSLGLCGQVRVEIFLPTEEEHVGFRSYGRQAMRVRKDM